jgi:trehalose 6-phosphate synthase
VLVQDYHLALIGTWLAQQRKDLRAVHFTHIPFCDPAALRILPTDVAEELLVGMASHSSCGFHASRWADAFEACCVDVLGLKPSTFVAPLAPDHDDIEAVSASDECATEAQWLAEAVGDRALVLRVDRIELSKNLLRGFDAFDLLLERDPDRRGRVVFGAFCYPSREGVPAYARYRDDVVARVAEINDRWGDADWTPILLELDDNFPRSLAAMRRSDVLVVNPVRDGLNLVAMEGALVNERNGGLVLSRNAGAWAALRAASDGVNPFDVSETASAMATALDRPAGPRRAQAEERRRIAAARTAHDWLGDQLAAATT